MSVITFTTATANIESIEAKIARYNKRAVKHGWEEIEYSIASSERVEKQDVSVDFSYSFTREVKVIDITIIVM